MNKLGQEVYNAWGFPVSPEGVVTGRLENWSTQRDSSEDSYIIWGEIHDDVMGRWEEGTRIHTSGIKNVDEPIGGLRKGTLIKTRNSLYELGEPEKGATL